MGFDLEDYNSYTCIGRWMIDERTEYVPRFAKIKNIDAGLKGFKTPSRIEGFRIENQHTYQVHLM